MSGSVEIKDIVDYLKNPPFNRNEGLVDFSKKSPIELLQVVNDVFAEMDDRQRKDLRDESKDAMTARMLEFVTVLGYKIEGDISKSVSPSILLIIHNTLMHSNLFAHAFTL